MTSAQALQAILGSLAVLVGLVVQSKLAARETRNQHAEVTEKLDVVEQTVNGNFDKATTRIEQLAAALTAHGIAVPPTPGTEEA